ncbi:hypothetical protein IAE22_27875 [Bacillus sp. S34]|nr:hypothetical protein [Bacillus sp. S34]
MASISARASRWYAATLTRYAWALADDRMDVEEIVQDAFLTLWQRATTLELRDRLARVRPDVEVTGVEIEPARVALANAGTRDGVTFRRGGFETPPPVTDGRR